MSKKLKFTIAMTKNGKRWCVQCKELPGAVSEGKTKKKALRNIRDAIKGILKCHGELSEVVGTKYKKITFKLV